MNLQDLNEQIKKYKMAYCDTPAAIQLHPVTLHEIIYNSQHPYSSQHYLFGDNGDDLMTVFGIPVEKNPKLPLGFALMLPTHAMSWVPAWASWDSPASDPVADIKALAYKYSQVFKVPVTEYQLDLLSLLAHDAPVEATVSDDELGAELVAARLGVELCDSDMRPADVYERMGIKPGVTPKLPPLKQKDPAVAGKAVIGIAPVTVNAGDTLTFTDTPAGTWVSATVT